MRKLVAGSLLGVLAAVAAVGAVDEAPPPTPAPAATAVTAPPAATPSTPLATMPVKATGPASLRPDLAAEARAIGAQLGALELATWQIVAAGGDDDAVVAAVKAHLAAQRAALKSAIASSSTVRCQAEGDKMALRLRGRLSSVPYRESYNAAAGELAAIKVKATEDEATRAVAARVAEEERVFRVELCREILAEKGGDQQQTPPLRREQVDLADS